MPGQPYDRSYSYLIGRYLSIHRKQKHILTLCYHPPCLSCKLKSANTYLIWQKVPTMYRLKYTRWILLPVITANIFGSMSITDRYDANVYLTSLWGSFSFWDMWRHDSQHAFFYIYLFIYLSFSNNLFQLVYCILLCWVAFQILHQMFHTMSITIKVEIFTRECWHGICVYFP